MKNQEIKKIIEKMITEDWKIKFANEKAIEKIPLSCEKIGMNAIQMYELLMQIEEVFHIYFTAQEIRKYRFNTIEEIAKAVSVKMGTENATFNE